MSPIVFYGTSIVIGATYDKIMEHNDRHDILWDIMEASERYACRPAMVIREESFTYRHLAGNTKVICNMLDGMDDGMIGIAAEDTAETYASILAVLMTGRTYVILHPSYPPERNMQIARQAGIRTMLYCMDDCGMGKHEPEIKRICTAGTGDIPAGGTFGIKDTDAPAYIIFTSGSTGEPKGVPITRTNLDTFYKSYSRLGWKLDENDRMLQMFELTFDVSVVSFLYPLTLGACVYTVPSGGMKYLDVMDIMERHDLTFAAIAPSVLRLLRKYFGEIRLPCLRYLVVTAEAADPELLEDFRSCIPNASVVNLYGPTEATIYCTCYHVPANGCKHHNGMVAIGQAFQGITAMIAGDNGHELPDGEAGELWVSGKQVMKGYWNAPEMTEKSLVRSEEGTVYYKTGDICFKDKDGDIIYCGRKDNQVKIQGFRIELSEIEYRAKSYFRYSCNTVALAVPGHDGSIELHLAVERENGDASGLERYLQGHLPYYMIPKQIHFLPDFPQNASNKTDRKKIMKMIQGYGNE